MCYFQHYTHICPRCRQPLPNLADDFRRVCDLRFLRGSCVPLTEEPIYQRPGTISVPSVFECAQCEKEKFKRAWKSLLALIRMKRAGEKHEKIEEEGESVARSGAGSGTAGTSLAAGSLSTRAVK